MKIKVFLLFLLLFSQEAFTSKEGVLRTKSFHIESDGIGASGPVSVSGKRNVEGKFESITVTAFGKSMAIDKALLGKIPELSNGVQLTFENGYPRLGGQTIYLIFLVGFTSSSKEKVVISINETGKSELVEL